MSDGTFVKGIEEIVKKAEAFKTITIDGRDYSDRVLTPVELPTAKGLVISTLTALRDYLTGNPDALAMTSVLVMVNDPVKVSVRSSLTGPFKQRDTYILAEWAPPSLRFGQFYDVENFNILLQADFMDYGSRADILQIVGNITDGVVKNFSDDGITQDVTIKKGITKQATIVVPNPVILRPYRTFPEVDQPPSNFVFRMRSGEQAPTCALFEADGGRWKSEAVKNVKDWLTNNLPEGVVVLA